MDVEFCEQHRQPRPTEQCHLGFIHFIFICFVQILSTTCNSVDDKLSSAIHDLFPESNAAPIRVISHLLNGGTAHISTRKHAGSRGDRRQSQQQTDRKTERAPPSPAVRVINSRRRVSQHSATGQQRIESGFVRKLNGC